MQRSRSDVLDRLADADPGPDRAELLAAEICPADAIRERAVRAGDGPARTKSRSTARAGGSRLLRRILPAAALVAIAVIAAVALLPASPERNRDRFEPPRRAGDPTERRFSSPLAALTAASAAAASNPGQSQSGPPAGGAGSPFPYVHLLEQDSELVGEGTIRNADGELRDGTRFVVNETTETETWFRDDGSTYVRGETSGAQYPSPEDEALARPYEEQGNTLAGPAGTGEGQRNPRMSRGRADQLGYYLLKPRRQRLPRDPAKLADLFASVKADSTSAGASDGSAAGDMVQTFDYASTLLLTAPYDKQLQAAAYEVVAGLDGVELRGKARDPIGRLGTAVIFKVALEGPDGLPQAPLTRYSLIFDTDSGDPLAYVKRQIDPKTDTGSPVVDYTVLVNSGEAQTIGKRPKTGR